MPPTPLLCREDKARTRAQKPCNTHGGSDRQALLAARSTYSINDQLQ
jgi:hypothetical protein